MGTHMTQKEELKEKWFAAEERAFPKIVQELRKHNYREYSSIRGGSRSNYLFSDDDHAKVVVVLFTYDGDNYQSEVRSFDPEMVKTVNKLLRPLRRVEKQMSELLMYETLGGSDA